MSDKIFPALQIHNIIVYEENRLDNCSSGFDNKISTFGYKLCKQKDGFFIVFEDKQARTNYLKNSKWFKSLKRNHIAPGVEHIRWELIDYNQEEELIIPYLQLKFLPERFDMSEYYDNLQSLEEILINYIIPGEEDYWKTCKTLIDNLLKSANYSCYVYPKSVCNTHIIHAHLLRRVGQASPNPERYQYLLDIAIQNIYSCRSSQSKIVMVDLLLSYPMRMNGKSKRIHASEIILDICCSGFEKDSRRIVLINHVFNMACICFEMEELQLTEKHLENLKKMINDVKGIKQDKSIARIKSASHALSKKIQNGATGPHSSRLIISNPGENIKQDSPVISETCIIRIADIKEVVSNTEMIIDVFQLEKPFKICTFEIGVYDVNKVLVNNLEFIDPMKHCATVKIEQENKVTAVFIQEKECLDTGSECSELDPEAKGNRVVTFNPNLDISYLSDQGEEFDDNIFADIGLSDPINSSSNVDVLTTGIEDIDKIFIDLEEFMLEKLKEKSNKTSLKDMQKMANSMADNWRRQKDWFGEYWEHNICNSYDSKTGKYFQPKDANLDKILEDLNDKFTYSQNLAFNKRQFITITAQFMFKASVEYLGQKQKERECPNEGDDDLTKSFKQFWQKNKSKHISFDDIQDVFHTNHVTIRFLHQGYTVASQPFSTFVQENLSLEGFMREEFTTIFTNFFGEKQKGRPVVTTIYDKDSIVDITEEEINEITDQNLKETDKILMDNELDTVLQDINLNLTNSKWKEANEQMENSDTIKLNITEDNPHRKLKLIDPDDVLIMEEETNEITEENLKVTEMTRTDELNVLLERIKSRIINKENKTDKEYLDNLEKYFKRGKMLIEKMAGLLISMNKTKLMSELEIVLQDMDGILSSTKQEDSNDQMKFFDHIIVDKNEDNPDTKLPLVGPDGTTQQKMETFDILTDIADLTNEVYLILESPSADDLDYINDKLRNIKDKHIDLPDKFTQVLEPSLSKLKEQLKTLMDDTCNQPQREDKRINEIQKERKRKNEIKQQKIEKETQKEMYTNELQEKNEEISSLTSRINFLQSQISEFSKVEEELWEEIYYHRKHKDSSLIRSLEQKDELETKISETKKDNQELQQKIKQLESQLMESQLSNTKNVKVFLREPTSGKVCTMSVNSNNLLPYKSVQECYPCVSTIKYRHISGAWRVLILEEEYFQPPEDDWGNREYEVVVQPPNASPRKVHDGYTRMKQSTFPINPQHQLGPRLPNSPLISFNPNPPLISFNPNSPLRLGVRPPYYPYV